ncbi:MAG: phage tail tape measure protein [Sphingomonadales bacterium]
MARNITARLDADIKLFRRNLKRADNQLGRWSRKTERVTRKIARDFSRIGSGLTRSVTLPLGLAGVAAGRMQVRFDDSLTKIVSLVGLSEKAVARFREEILKIAPAVGKGPAELAEGLFFVTSAGKRGQAALDTLIASAKGAAAGLGDVAIIADAATSATNAYGDENLAAADAVGVLVATVREGKAGADTITASLGRVIPVAAQLGVTFNEVGAALATMTKFGLNAEESSTALRATLTSILKPAVQQEEAARKLGLSFADLRKQLGTEGLLPVLKRIKTAIGEDDAAIAKIFPNVRALTGVLTLVGKNAAIADQVFSSLATAGVADLIKAFDIAAKSSGLKFLKTTAQINVAMIRLGDIIIPKILPLIQRMAAALARWSEALSTLSEKTKDVLLATGAFTLLVGPMLSAIGFMVIGISGLARAFVFVARSAVKSARVLLLAVSGMVKAVSAGFTRLLALVGGVPLAIGSAIAAVAGALFVFRDTVIGFAKGLIDALQKFFVANFNNNIVIPFKKLLRSIVEILPDSVVDFLGLEPIRVPDLIESSFVDDMGQVIADAAVNARREAAAFGALFAGLGTRAKNALQAVLPAGIGELLFGDGGIERFMEDVGGAFDELGEKFKELGVRGKAAGDSTGDAMVEAGRAVKDGVANSVEDAIVNLRSLSDAAKSIARIIRQEILRAAIAKPIGDFIGTAIGSLFPTGKAGGGDVQPGVPVLVGERGPELLVPKVASTVRNSSDSRTRLGGPVVNQTINMSFTSDVKNSVRAEILTVAPAIAQQAAASVTEQLKRSRRL